MRQKIDYGIDLGTTNSAIARMEDGQSVIIKSDDTLMDTTSSVVSFDRKQSLWLGLKAKNGLDREAASNFRSRKQADPNGYQEFKRNMGTNYNFILLSSQKIILIERDDGRKKQVMEKKATVSFA